MTSDGYNCGLKLSVCFFPKGVASHVGFTLAQWNDGKVDEPLSRATFTSENKPLSVNCEVKLSCSKPSLNTNFWLDLTDFASSDKYSSFYHFLLLFSRHFSVSRTKRLIMKPLKVLKLF